MSKWNVFCKTKRHEIWVRRCLICLFLDRNFLKKLLLYWNAHLWICQNEKVLDKINSNNKTNCDQTCLIWVFRQEFDKIIGIVYFKLKPSNFSKCKVSCKTKEISNLSPKVHYSGIFRLTFEKAIVIFEINTFEFFKSQKVMQNKETSNLEPNLLIWVFLGCNFEIVLLQYLKQVFLNFPKNGFLTSTGNFDVGSTFYEGPESTFSESVDLGLGPLN